jgi:hypothetical protein
MARPAFAVTKANIYALIGHLDFPDYDAVLVRASQLAQQHGEANIAEADALEALTRLAQAMGMPEGGVPIPWLLDRAAIEKIEGGWRVIPRSVT